MLSGWCLADTTFKMSQVKWWSAPSEADIPRYINIPMYFSTPNTWMHWTAYLKVQSSLEKISFSSLRCKVMQSLLFFFLPENLIRPSRRLQRKCDVSVMGYCWEKLDITAVSDHFGHLMIYPKVQRVSWDNNPITGIFRWSLQSLQYERELLNNRHLSSGLQESDRSPSCAKKTAPITCQDNIIMKPARALILSRHYLRQSRGQE